MYRSIKFRSPSQEKKPETFARRGAKIGALGGLGLGGLQQIANAPALKSLGVSISPAARAIGLGISGIPGTGIGAGVGKLMDISKRSAVEEAKKQKVKRLYEWCEYLSHSDNPETLSFAEDLFNFAEELESYEFVVPGGKKIIRNKFMGDLVKRRE